MIIDCIADMHGHYPKLEGGDLLIIAGDLTARDTPIEHINFYEWCEEQLYRKIIIIGGNHDNFIHNLKSKYFPPTIYYSHCEYLCDSGTEFEGLKIWGSPWTKTFEGMNPKCKAFTCDTEEEMAEKFNLIPHDIDILITHVPPYGIFDKTINGDLAGSRSLLIKIAEIKPLVHAFGHIHENGNKNTWFPWKNGSTFVNCSYVNEQYQPVNKPIRIEL